MGRASDTRESERHRLSLDALQGLQVKDISVEIQPAGERQRSTYPEVPYGSTIPCCAQLGCWMYGCVWNGKDPRTCLPIFLNANPAGESDHRIGTGINVAALLPCGTAPHSAEMVRAPRDVKELLALYHKGESNRLGIEAFRKKEAEKERISGRMKL